jgi:hypothetical protein
MPTVTLQVSQSTDDADELTGTTQTNLTSVTVASEVTGFEPTHGGFRFQNVPIPGSSLIFIESAYLKPVLISDAATGNQDDAACDIYGHAADNSATFTGGGADITGRARTTASVAWDEDDLGDGLERVVSPNLRAIIQEIIDRPGWSLGNSLSLLLIGRIQGSAKTATFESYDESAVNAAELEITWSTGWCLEISEPPPWIGTRVHKRSLGTCVQQQSSATLQADQEVIDVKPPLADYRRPLRQIVGKLHPAALHQERFGWLPWAGEADHFHRADTTHYQRPTELFEQKNGVIHPGAIQQERYAWLTWGAHEDKTQRSELTHYQRPAELFKQKDGSLHAGAVHQERFSWLTRSADEDRFGRTELTHYHRPAELFQQRDGQLHPGAIHQERFAWTAWAKDQEFELRPELVHYQRPASLFQQREGRLHPAAVHQETFAWAWWQAEVAITVVAGITATQTTHIHGSLQDVLLPVNVSSPSAIKLEGIISPAITPSVATDISSFTSGVGNVRLNPGAALVVFGLAPGDGAVHSHQSSIVAATSAAVANGSVIDGTFTTLAPEILLGAYTHARSEVTGTTAVFPSASSVNLTALSITVDAAWSTLLQTTASGLANLISVTNVTETISAITESASALQAALMVNSAGTLTGSVISSQAFQTNTAIVAFGVDATRVDAAGSTFVSTAAVLSGSITGQSIASTVVVGIAVSTIMGGFSTEFATSQVTVATSSGQLQGHFTEAALFGISIAGIDHTSLQVDAVAAQSTGPLVASAQIAEYTVIRSAIVVGTAFSTITGTFSTEAATTQAAVANLSGEAQGHLIQTGPLGISAIGIDHTKLSVLADAVHSAGPLLGSAQVSERFGTATDWQSVAVADGRFTSQSFTSSTALVQVGGHVQFVITGAVSTSLETWSPGLGVLAVIPTARASNAASVLADARLAAGLAVQVPVDLSAYSTLIGTTWTEAAGFMSAFASGPAAAVVNANMCGYLAPSLVGVDLTGSKMGSISIWVASIQLEGSARTNVTGRAATVATLQVISLIGGSFEITAGVDASGGSTAAIASSIGILGLFSPSFHVFAEIRSALIPSTVIVCQPIATASGTGALVTQVPLSANPSGDVQLTLQTAIDGSSSTNLGSIGVLVFSTPSNLAASFTSVALGDVTAVSPVTALFRGDVDGPVFLAASIPVDGHAPIRIEPPRLIGDLVDEFGTFYVGATTAVSYVPRSRAVAYVPRSVAVAAQ